MREIRLSGSGEGAVHPVPISSGAFLRAFARAGGAAREALACRFSQIFTYASTKAVIKIFTRASSKKKYQPSFMSWS
jgi:hypothetical protein